MSKIIIFALVILAALAVGMMVFVRKTHAPVAVVMEHRSTSMELTSPDFVSGTPIPVEFTCDGRNFNPALHINGTPSRAQALALVVSDPDSPSGNFLHWAIWNIKPGVSDIARNSTPEGAETGQNDFGDIKYGGPCPGSGEHHYVFTVYALDKKLVLHNPGKDELMSAINQSRIDEATLIGTYRRSGR